MSGKKKTYTKEECAEQALALAAKRSWMHVGLDDIDGARDHFQEKADMLAVFARMIDRQVLEKDRGAEADMSCRDRLFDIVMDRYEALNAYRSGLVSVLDSFTLDPKQALISFPHLFQSMARMLEAAGIETEGIPGALKIAGLAGVYIHGLKVWKSDESPDLARVMAALDKDLGRAEHCVNFLSL